MNITCSENLLDSIGYTLEALEEFFYSAYGELKKEKGEFLIHLTNPKKEKFTLALESDENHLIVTKVYKGDIYFKKGIMILKGKMS